jgi:hypothetical protein
MTPWHSFIASMCRCYFVKSSRILIGLFDMLLLQAWCLERCGATEGRGTRLEKVQRMVFVIFFLKWLRCVACLRKDSEDDRRDNSHCASSSNIKFICAIIPSYKNNSHLCLGEYKPGISQ